MNIETIAATMTPISVAGTQIIRICGSPHWVRPFSEKRPIIAAVAAATGLAVMACVLVLRLVYVGQPGAASSLQFRGFVLLPKGASLTVLDYLTVSERSLFVTDESTARALLAGETALEDK